MTTDTSESQKVWVVTLEARGTDFDDVLYWHSVHATQTGAQRMIETRAAEWGLDLAAIDSGEDDSGSTYMLAHLPVQE